MKFIPHDYQNTAIRFIENNDVSALILDMGLGKTVITLTAIAELIATGEVNKVLVVAPLRVARDTWSNEVNKWEHLNYLRLSVVVGSAKERLDALKSDADVYVINRDVLPWLLTNIKQAPKFDMIVIDELSSFKNYRSQRFKSLRKIKGRDTKMVGLTGTPASNGLMDLFAEIGILDGGEHLGRYITHYRDKYFDKYGDWSYVLRNGAEERIYQAIEPISISMKAVDYLDMPEKVLFNDYVAMEKDEKEKYNYLRKNFILSLDENTVIDSKSAATLSMKLSQLANGFLYDEEKNIHPVHNHKVEALEEIVEEANGKPVLVAYWFKADLKAIQSTIKDAKELKTSEDFRAWNEGKIRVALIHPASAGHGLNLQEGGNILVWYGLTWSLELYEQTNARLYRQGQKAGSVIIRHILTKGTIDEQIIRALEGKRLTQDALIEAIKVSLT